MAALAKQHGPPKKNAWSSSLAGASREANCNALEMSKTLWRNVMWALNTLEGGDRTEQMRKPHDADDYYLGKREKLREWQ